MNIYQALQEDHRRFDKLLDALVETSNAGSNQWKGALDALRQAVIPHSHAEEAIFYNALRETDEAKGLIRHSFTEHAKAEAEIRMLGAAKFIDANWTGLVKKLHHDLSQHITHEEQSLFPIAQRLFSETEAEKLGMAFESLKAEMAKDADSVLASTVDLIANLIPGRFVNSLRKGNRPHKSAA